MSSDDNKSVSSATSASSISLGKVDCPHCNKAFQVRYMFNHIYSKHTEKYLENIDNIYLLKHHKDFPLRVFWKFTNDFDEEEEKAIYACLATKKTFATQERAMLHFKKDKDALKEHNAELKKLKKHFSEEKKEFEDEQTKRRNSIKRLEASNDIQYCRNLWRYVLHWEEIAKIMCLLIKDRKKLDHEITYGKLYGWTTWDDVLRAYESAKQHQDDMIKLKVCNAKQQWSLWETYDRIIDAHQEMGVYAEPFDCFRSERYPTNYKICLPSPYDKNKIDEMPPYPF